MNILDHYTEVGDEKLFSELKSQALERMHQGEDIKETMDCLLCRMIHAGNHVSAYASMEPERARQETEFISKCSRHFNDIFEDARQATDPLERKKVFTRGKAFAARYMADINDAYEARKKQADALLEEKGRLRSKIAGLGEQINAFQADVKKQPEDGALQEKLERKCDDYINLSARLTNAENKWCILNLAMETDYKSFAFFQDQKERFQDIVKLYEK